MKIIQERMQNNARKLLRQIGEHAGSIKELSRKIKIPGATLYNFLSGETGTLSEKTGEKLMDYCLKYRIKITMKDLRPHMRTYK